MTLLVDMNLSPRFASALNESGFSALHWSEVGALMTFDEKGTRIRELPL